MRPSLYICQVFICRRQWYVRQTKDPFVKAAQDVDYRSRAAFKLLQLDQKYNLIYNGLTAVDLGAAPGGWSQVIVKKGGSVVAVDLLRIPMILRL